MKREGIAHLIPSPTIVTPSEGKGYRWVLAYFARDQIEGSEDEVLHIAEGIEFLIDCHPVFLDDLRERTLTATETGFEFLPQPRPKSAKDIGP